MPKINLNTVVFAIFALTVSPAAFAYLDPSTSGMIISAIVGIFASAALAVKTYWYRIKAFFRTDQTNSDQSDSDKTSSDQTNSDQINSDKTSSEKSGDS
jgi:hypothetical protein